MDVKTVQRLHFMFCLLDFAEFFKINLCTEFDASSVIFIKHQSRGNRKVRHLWKAEQNNPVCNTGAEHFSGSGDYTPIKTHL